MAANDVPQRTQILQTHALDLGSFPRPEPSTVLFSPEEIRAIEATSSRTVMIPAEARLSRPAPSSVAPVAITGEARASAAPVALYAVLGAIFVVAIALLGPRAMLAQDRTWIAPTVLTLTNQDAATRAMLFVERTR